MSKNDPGNVDELFPSKWLKASDLPPGGITVNITAYRFEDLRDFSGQTKRKLVLTFANAEKELVMNKTQADELTMITGNNEFKTWPGHSAHLSPAPTFNGKQTIRLTAPQEPPADDEIPF